MKTIPWAVKMAPHVSLVWGVLIRSPNTDSSLMRFRYARDTKITRKVSRNKPYQELDASQNHSWKEREGLR